MDHPTEHGGLEAGSTETGKLDSGSPHTGGSQDDIERIFREAAARYIAARRAAVKPFVARHFGLRGTLRLHRAAVGLDVIRAPANLALAIPNIAAKLGGVGYRRLPGRPTPPRWLGGRDLFIRTAVDRRVEWLVHTELLELPFEQGNRESRRDALALGIMSHPDVAETMALARAAIDGRTRDPELAERLTDNLIRYTGTRAAASDMLAALSSMGAGGFLVHKLTPSALSLGPALAALAAHNAAVAGFPLGATLGGYWYGMFPVVPSTGLVVGMTGGLIAGVAATAAFAGIVADPLQRLLGIHERRLNKLIDALEADLLGDAGRFTVKAHYVARLVDFFECVRAAYRVI